MKFTDWFTQHKDADVRARVRSATMLRMSEKERDRGREFVMRYMAMHPAQQKSTVSRFAFLFNPMPIIASFLIVVLSGVSMVGAAESALPGDALYSVKVNVNEEVRLALATPAQKADVAVERAERRIAELETLTARGDVDQTLREEIDARLDSHVQEAEAASITRETGRDVERRVVAVLRAHEALVAPGEFGGVQDDEQFDPLLLSTGVVEDADVSATFAMTAEAPANAGADVAMRSADAPTLMMAAEPVVETLAMETAAPEPVETSAAPNAKRTAPAISEKALQRQKKAAAERIATLEKLIVREEKLAEKRKNLRDIAILVAGVESARDAFANAEIAHTDGNVLDASALWNSAVRIAIDAREAYADSARNMNDAKDEDENEREVENESNDDSRGRPRVRGDN